MKSKFNISFWEILARIILRNRIKVLLFLGLITILLALQWKNLKMTYSEANMLPENHPINVDYQNFIKTFGEEGNIIVIAADIHQIFQPKNFQKWNELSTELQKFSQIDGVISLQTMKILAKDTIGQKFDLLPFLSAENQTEDLSKLKEKFLTDYPFYQGLLYNSEKNTLRTLVSMDKNLVNTAERKKFILNHFKPLLEKYRSEISTQIHISGMPYIRTLGTEIIIQEIGLFIFGALFITCLLFFAFFRSFRAMFISMGVVLLGVAWAFGFLGLFGYEITILTAVIPPLIIVIGLPNCIFLINRYQQEINKHKYQAMALQRVISKVGNVTLITNLTTAIGFATFTITKSNILREFGTIASICILSLFFISLCLIPVIYSFMPIPKEKHLKHLNRKLIERGVSRLRKVVKRHRFAVFATSVALLVVSIMGIYRMKVSGSLIEDMPKSPDFTDDIVYFEKNFGGVMPLEITIDTKRKNGVLRAENLQKMEQLEEYLSEIPEISEPISILKLVKYAKQSFYNGAIDYYELPTQQERNFILSYVRKSQTTQGAILKNLIDSNGQVARISVFMKDIGTDKMQRIEEGIAQKVRKIFPDENYQINITGKAYLFAKGTDYLVHNLIQTLLLTIVFIMGLMYYMFGSWRMVIISLIPNVLPLLITAGMMGFFGVPLKPSTILIFGIAFGISIDDTIHFLAKYRQELVRHNWKIRRSVYGALYETGVSMFYTSVVLFFGFSVFVLSSFGGTKALGVLVSITLLFAMLANLVLLPSLILALEKSLSNKSVFKKPSIDILAEEEK